MVSRTRKTIHVSDLEEMPLEELVNLRSEMDVLIKRKRKTMEKVIKSQMDELAKVAGYDSAEAFLSARSGTGRTGSGKEKPVVKYRSREDKNLTWSGRGKAPAWLREYEKKGGKREDLQV